MSVSRNQSAMLIAATLSWSAQLQAGGVPTTVMDTVTVVGKNDLLNQPSSSTQGYVTAQQLAERPVARAGELLEFVPGLMVTQHSGEGKANQFFLRGFNLDHGTDFYTEVDGLPVNMRTHAHGQGYADINFIIPELIGSLDYRKGPYYAELGDFASAGSANLRYKDELPATLAEVTVGSFGYRSALLAASPDVAGGKLLLGAKASRYDGPFTLDENIRRYTGIARYNQGTEREGLTASLMGYSIRYTAPDQIPLRAVEDGSLDRLGFIDPSDGGNVERYSANLEWRGLSRQGSWEAQAYALKYRMQLYSNFTYFLADPDNGDQFNQFDDRRVYGLNAHHDWRLQTAIPTDFKLGLQGRHDDIGTVGLYNTRQRERLSTTREDSVRESSLGLYASSSQQWTRWFRSELGLRFDTYAFDVDGDNAGSDNASIASPKLAMVLGPWQRTRFFLNYGEGFHSNDARGVTASVDPADALVKARGGELGVSSEPVPGLSLAASLWALNFDSELVYVGDAGNNEAGPASKRRGIELSGYYQIAPWLIFDADYAYAHARLRVEPSEGNRIPNSINTVFGLGLTVPETQGWSAGLRLRHLGAGPLIEDGSERSQPTTVVNLQVSRRLSPHWKARLDALNLFDSTDNDITYFYESRLPGEPDEGVADTHFHPVEPRALRLTVTAEF